MSELTYEGNSRAMFERLVAESPKPFRKNNEKKILASLTSKAGDSGTVTEDMIYETVNEITPKPFLKMTIKILDEMKSS